MSSWSWSPAAGALLLGGCASLYAKEPPPTPPPPPEPVAAERPAPPPPAPQPRVMVRQVRSACVPKDLPPPPRYPDTDKALKNAGGAADRYQLMAAGRLLRERRLELLERIIAGCR